VTFLQEYEKAIFILFKKKIIFLENLKEINKKIIEQVEEKMLKD